jgi:hypothetical protein
MNCNEFENQIIDAVRRGSPEGATEEHAMAHATGCLACAARLRNERRLSTELRELAVSYTEGAPPELEDRLVAAFRAARGARTSVRENNYWPAWRWVAVAAVLAALAIATIGAFRFVRRDAAPVVPKQTAELPDRKPDTVKQTAEETPDVASPRVAGAPRQRRNGTRSVRKTKLPPADASMASRPDGARDEIATAFIQLTGDGGIAGAESLKMVRIELPREALISFGLPMNMERADERIKADVLVGNDGVAHAIRFVR